MLKYTLLFPSRIKSDKEITDAIDKVASELVYITDVKSHSIELIADAQSPAIGQVLRELLNSTGFVVTKDFPGASSNQGHFIVLGKKAGSELASHATSLAQKLF